MGEVFAHFCLQCFWAQCLMDFVPGAQEPSFMFQCRCGRFFSG